jgi:hypothetical protein
MLRSMMDANGQALIESSMNASPRHAIDVHGVSDPQYQLTRDAVPAPVGSSAKRKDVNDITALQS